MSPPTSVFLVFYLLEAVVYAANIEDITMYAAPGYTNLRDCAKYCFYAGRGNAAADLSCSQNNCLCRAELVSDAHSAISSCLYTAQCQTSNPVDLSLGLSFYDGYCSNYRNAVLGVVPATTISANGPANTDSLRATVTVTASVTVLSTTYPYPTSAGLSLTASGCKSSFLAMAAAILSTTFAAHLFYTCGTNACLYDTSIRTALPTLPFITSTMRSTTAFPTSPMSTSTAPSRTPSDSSGSGGGGGKGLSWSDIITIIVGVLGAAVAIGVAIWQSRTESATRRRWREWRGTESGSYI